MKAVIDTNIFISGIHWSGASEKILIEWFDNKFDLISSEEIIQEIAKTLFNFKKYMPIEDIIHWISIIESKAIIIVPKVSFNAVKTDPDNNKFIDTAVEGDADYIVSQDNDLLDIKEFHGIKIISPIDFIKELERNQSVTF